MSDTASIDLSWLVSCATRTHAARAVAKCNASSCSSLSRAVQWLTAKATASKQLTLLPPTSCSVAQNSLALETSRKQAR